MANNPLFDRVKMSVSGSPGTGTITLDSAVAGFRSFDDAGVADGDMVSYLIEEDTAFEFGKGVYTSSGTTLSRDTVVGSSAGGTTKVSFTAAAVVYITALSQDIVQVNDDSIIARNFWINGGGSETFIWMEGNTESNFLSIAVNSAANTYYINGSGEYPLSLGTNDTIRLLITGDGNVLIGTTTAGASKLVVNDDSIQLNTSKTPASATATGTTGQIAWDSSYVYVCIDTDTWKRAAISTW